METRKEISTQIEEMLPKLNSDSQRTVAMLGKVLDVLLDIRDLLQPISNEAELHLQAKQAPPPVRN